MTNLTVRRFLVITVAIVLTLSLGTFAIPSVPVEAQSGSATVNFGTQYNYAVSGNSFSNTDAPVTGNKDWGSSVSGASVLINNVNLNLASSTSFDNVNPTPTKITGSYNYLWAVGTLSAGGSLYTRVGLNNSPVTYTPGFDASRSVDNTTFTKNGTQTLTVSVTPDETLPNINIGVNVQKDQYVTPTIESVTPSGAYPSAGSSISTDGSQANINIPSPTKGTTYTYTITIQLILQSGVTQLDYMPSVGVTSQSIVAGSSTGKSVSNATTEAGTWTWSSDDSITWNWNEVLSQGVSFPFYSISPGANVNFNTNYNYTVSGDSFTDAKVTGNEGWGSGLNGANTSLNNVTLILAGSTSFSNVNPTPTKITGSNYEWDFNTVPTGGNPNVNVKSNTSSVSFTPGFNASISADNTTFTKNGTQTLTVSVTPDETLPNINIGVNVPGGDQYANATIESVTPSSAYPSASSSISTDGSQANINIPSPTNGTTYTYTITIQLTLQSGVTQLEFIPGVNVGSYQSEGNGSVTGTSVIDKNDAGTWTWSSTDSIIWNWNAGLSQGVNFQGYSTATISPSANVNFNTNYNYTVSGDSFTDAKVTGNEGWNSGLNGASTSLNNVTLKLASSTSFNNENPTPTITGSTGAYNYQWNLGTIPAGGGANVGVGLNNNPVTFTPGFNASVSADNTTFTKNGTQTLTVSVTPDETLPNINIGVNVPGGDQYANATIESVTPSSAYPSASSSISTDGSQANINIPSPTNGTTYTYTITIQLTLQSGVTQLEFIPGVNVGSYQSEGNGSVTGTSVIDKNDAGTWTWSSTDSIIWNWNAGLSQGVNFQGYSTATISPSANVNFNTNYNYTVSGDSFTDAKVTGNEGWGSGLNGANTSLNNVTLILAGSTSFSNVNPTPTKITGSNYEWDFNTVPTGGNPNVNVKSNTSSVSFTPGFNASISADNTTFTKNGTQTLTVSVTPDETLPNINIGVNVPGGDQYANATIESVTPSGAYPSASSSISTDGSQANINIPSPTNGTTYTYTITIQLTLQSGVTQLEFMPGVNVGSYQSEGNGSVTGTSVIDKNDAGTWTWSSTDSIIWNWNAMLSQGVNFQGYSNVPSPTSADVASFTCNGYEVPGDSFTNGQVTGNEYWLSEMTWASTSLNNVSLILASSTSFVADTTIGPLQPPNSITGSTGAYNYLWDLGTVPTGGGVGGAVRLNNSSITFTPGFDASVSADNTTFTKNGTQTLTVSVTPREALVSGGIGLNVAEDQYVNPTIEWVTPAGGVPTNPGISNDGKNLFFPINGPTEGTTYTYTITIQVNLQPGVTQLDYMPGVNVNAFTEATGGSVTGTSVSIPTTGVGTWTWSSTDSVIWSWAEGIDQTVAFQSYEAAASTATPVILQSLAITTPGPSIAVGNTLALTASGTYSNSTIANLTAAATGTIWASLSPTVATVSVNGVVTGVKAGTATITANNNGASASVTVTVTAPVLVNITVAPANPTVPVGQTQQFIATGTYSDNSTQNLTATVNWTSSVATKATIAASGLATTIAAGPTNITATLGGVTSNTAVLTVTTATLVSIAVTPVSASIAAGRTQQFTATGTYSDNSTQNLTTMVNWTSSVTTKATIAASGLAATIAAGPTNITATLGGVTSNTAVLTVTTAALVSIAVTPANPSVAQGLKQQFIATGTYSDGTTQNLTTTASWTSTDLSKATIGTATGLAIGTGIGSSTITANVGGAGGVNGSTTLTVTPATLTSIAVTPAAASIAAGKTQQFTATGTYSDNSTQNITATATWTSSTIATASINAAGLATGAFAGSATISVVQDGVSSSLAPGNGATLTVTPAVVTAVNVTPANPTIKLGSTQQFRAMAVYSNGSIIEVTATATWTSGTPANATINAAGLATAVSIAAPSNSTITATVGNLTGSTLLTVTSATLVSIAVTPVSASIAAGRTQQFTATGTYSDNSKQNLTAMVNWTSSVTTKATIAASGLATTIAAGPTNITATLGGVTSNTAVLTVTPPVLNSITVTPGNPSLTFISGAGNAPMLQFNATGNYTDGTTTNLTSTAVWKSDTPTTATINATGLLTTVANGTSTISAASGGQTGTSTLTVLADTVAPVVTLTSPTAGMVLSNNSLNISGSVDDKSAATTLILNGGTPIILVLDSSGNFSKGVLLNTGNNTIQVMAVDAVGNTGSSGTRNVIVNPNTPAVAITSPSNGLLTNVASQTVTGTVTGATAVTLRVNGVAVTPAPTVTSGAFTATITLTEGDNLITTSAYATGHDGDTNYLGTSGTMTVTLDTIAPVVTINAPAAGSIVSSAGVAVSGTINDTSISMALLTLNGGTAQDVPVIGGNFSQNITLVSGHNTIAVVATDSVGNTSSSVPITITLDNTKPGVIVTAPANNLMTNVASVTVTGNTDDLTGTGTLYLNGESQPLSIAPDGSFSLAVPLGSGANTIEVRVADQATPPNVGTSGTITVTLDTTAPVLTIGLSDPTESTTIMVSSDKSLASVPTVLVGATSVAMTSVAMNEWTGTYGSAAAPIAAGDYIVTVTGTDEAGNQATATSSFCENSISVDGVNPTLVDPVSTSLLVQTYGVVSGASISVTTSLENPSGNVGHPNGASTSGGAFVEINASDTLRNNLNQIYIQVDYDPAELPPGTDESSLKLYLWDVTQGIWQLVPNSGVNTTDHYIYGTVKHLSDYGVFGTAATSSDATLSNLTISSGTLTPAFASGTTGYTDNVANTVTSVTVTPTVNQSNATVKVNGTAVTSGSASGNINLNVGTNTITVVVTAQDGITKDTYTVTVTRAAPVVTLSRDATLSSLAISPGTLSPGFTSANTTYVVNVDNSVNSVTVTPTVNQANAAVTVNGYPVTSGSASGGINLNVGTNTITVLVTAQDGNTKITYTISVTEAAAATTTTTQPPTIVTVTVTPTTTTTTTMTTLPPGTTDVSNDINSSGTFISAATASSADGNVTVNIPAGVTGLTVSSAPITEISITPITTNLPPLPSDGAAVGLYYDIQPSGSTFSSNITITMSYDPSLVPLGLSPYVAWYNPAIGQWEQLTTVSIDTVNHTITASVDHFSTFAALASLSKTSTTTSSAAGTTTKNTRITTTASTTTTKSSVNGLIIGVIIGAIIVIALIIWMVTRRRHVT